MDVGKELERPKDDRLAEQLGRVTLNGETKEEFMAKLRTLAESIDFEEIFKATYKPETDAEHTSYSAFNENVTFNSEVVSSTWGPAVVNDEKFSDTFGSPYDAHHVSPIIVTDIGDDYKLNPNYARELAEKRRDQTFYNEDGSLKTTIVEKGSTVEAPTYNRSLAPTENTIEDIISEHIRTYVQEHGSDPQEFFNEVERIRNEKYTAFYEKKTGQRLDEIRGRTYEGGAKMPECVIQ